MYWLPAGGGVGFLLPAAVCVCCIRGVLGAVVVFVAAAGGGVPAAYYFRAVVLLGLLCCCPLFVVSLLLEGVVIGKGGKNKIKHQYQPKLYPHH